MISIEPGELWSDLETIRKKSPLVHNITNYVVMNSTANALLALGASPVMAHAAEEIEDMVGLASALVVNIGTLSPAWVFSMRKAMSEAGKKGIPVVLDPVGAGATRFRSETALTLLSEGKPAIVRGNASEILALGAQDAKTKGVDSLHRSDEAVEAARILSEKFGVTVSISGPSDMVVNGKKLAVVSNGHPMMPRVTGMGCTASALTGAFAAVNPSAFKAAAHAMAVMGIAGELAAGKAAGPGTFQACFIDALYSLGLKDISEKIRVETRES
ncbi:MAG: hydroxyethylthiazole kinase [Candidatus Aminicenantes bacterium]|nr:hydroxyethylthiazole kinase [Candidatus Aminicenantes bacterium]